MSGPHDMPPPHSGDIMLPPLSLIADVSSALLVLVDPDGSIRWANQTFLVLAGLQDLAAAVGRKTWSLLPVEVGLTAQIGQAPLPDAAGVTSLDVPDQVWTDNDGQQRRIMWTLSWINDQTWPGWLLATGVDVTRERVRESAWRERANTDPLTGLANRGAASARLNACLTGIHATGCAVLLCDLNGFKTINDTYGHAAGDTILINAAERLTQLVRHDDLVARWGGDEFLLILPAATNARAHSLATAIKDSVRQPIPLAAGHSVAVSISVGVRTAAPGEGATAVLHDADQAMYKDKRRNNPPCEPAAYRDIT